MANWVVNANANYEIIIYNCLQKRVLFGEDVQQYVPFYDTWLSFEIKWHDYQNKCFDELKTIYVDNNVPYFSQTFGYDGNTKFVPWSEIISTKCTLTVKYDMIKW